MANYSPEFEASNKLDAKNMFLQRQYYDRQASFLFELYTETPNFIDLWYETPFYGKVDRNGTLVLVDQRRLNYSGQGETILLNFVSDAFADFRSYMSRARRRGKTSLSNAVFGNFEPQKTYVDPMAPFLKQALSIILVFNATIIRSHKIVAHMEAYINEFLKYFETISDSFTFSSFFASSKIGINSTGLAIDLLDLDGGRDFNKNGIFKNNEFYFYVQTAANFGFRIDKNVPWRLIADLSSTAMQKYFIKYNFPNAGSMFQSYFTPTIFYDAYAMLVLLSHGYKEYQTSRRYEYKTSHCFKAQPRFKIAITSDVVSKMKQIIIEKMDYSTFLEKYYNAKFIKTMEKIKHMEMKGKRLPHYHDFKKRFKALLGPRAERTSLEGSQAALKLLADYYNPANIYGAGTAKIPYYLKKPKIIPTEKKYFLTYKETAATLYKTGVNIPQSVDLDASIYVKKG